MNVQEIKLLENIVLTSPFENDKKTFTKSDLKFLIETSPIDVLNLSSVCLYNFFRSNFVGPPIVESEWSPVLSEENVSPNEEFFVDGDFPYPLVRNINYLTLSKWITIDYCDILRKNYPLVDIWGLRCLFLWQKLLPSKSSTLKTEVIQRCNLVEKLLETISDDKSEIAATIYVEIGNIYLYYYEYKLAEEAIMAASKVSKLNVKLTGVLGRKTKFQQFDVAQLIVQVETEESKNTDDVGLNKPHLPVDCRLNDDTLLEKPNLSSIFENVSLLNDQQQIVVLALRKLALEGKAVDELSDEESDAYLNKILEQPRCWTIQTSALFARSLKEMNNRRKMERSLSQLEELVQQFNNDKNKTDVVENRLKHAFACDVPSIWEVEKTLANVLTRLGATRSALDIYCRLQMWPEVIQCYKQLNMLDRAESLIRERLAEKETPQMFCLLGDITLQEDYYHKAWALSNHRYAEAQKRLGFHYFNRKFYDKAVDSLQSAVKLQPLQTDTWFTLGFCSVQVNRHDLAAEAYRRCVNIEPDNFEAWNNLAAAYVNLNRKEHAFQILQEAVKYSFDNWKIWDNIVLVGVDVGRFDESIRGLHRLLDLKEKYYDPKVLAALVQSINGKKFGEEQQDYNILKVEMKKYFGRLTSTVTGDALVWRFYADLSKPESNDESVSEWEKYFHLLQKAHNCAFQKANWEKNIDECRRILNYANKLAQTGLKLIELEKNETKSIQIKSSVRLPLKSLIGTIQKNYYGDEILMKELENLRAMLILVD